MHEWKLWAPNGVKLIAALVALIGDDREFSVRDDRGGSGYWIVTVEGGDRPGAEWELIEQRR